MILIYSCMRIKVILFLYLLSSVACQYSSQTYKEGRILFDRHCAQCHGSQGEGFGNLYPNLYNLTFISANRSQISCWIHKGIGPDSTNARPSRYNEQTMPPQRSLSPIEICNVLNYMNARFWKMEAFTLQEVINNLDSCRSF